MYQVFVSWSGGKDSCLAGYKALVSGLKIRYLLNMVTEDGRQSWTHGLSTELLQMQARAVGIPLIQKRTTTADYETEFRGTIYALKQEGVTGGVFGDVDIEEHREWVNRICQSVDILPHLPLWGRSQELVLRDFIESGFDAILVTAKADLLSEEWLGRRVDRGFVRELDSLRKTKAVTLCGEAGEYHTFVTDGPLFDQRIEILETNKVLREGYWFLEISRYELGSKE